MFLVFYFLFFLGGGGGGGRGVGKLRPLGWVCLLKSDLLDCIEKTKLLTQVLL